mgnify:CR=1 FL=1
MDAPHRTSRQGRVSLFFESLHSPFGFGIVIHLLDLNGGEPLELYPSDGGYDVVFDHVLIGLCGVGADHRLAVGFKPQPAPLRYGIVLVVVDRYAPVIPDGLRQFLFALGLRPGGHAFLNGAAGVGVDALGVSALPAAVGLFPDAALTVCSFLCHCSSLLLQHKQIPQNF